MVISDQLELSTKGNADIHDITDEVGRLVRGSGVQDGVVTIFTPSATCAGTTATGTATSARRCSAPA